MGKFPLEAHLLWVVVRDTLLPDVENAMYWYEQPKEARATWLRYNSWLTYLWAFMNYSPPAEECR